MQAFCKWDGKRLATETEWEAAARHPHVGWAEQSRPYPWGDEVPIKHASFIRASRAALAFLSCVIHFGVTPSQVPRNESTWRLNLWQGDFPRSDAGLDGHVGLAPADAYEPSAIGVLMISIIRWSSHSNHRVIRWSSGSHPMAIK